ncbi:hypothetical protein QTQ03_22050 [Micromonospora sp. WMMA1363]|uniref:hypothetical protein n=1 Tax=Micromonospora sp. WMMA1363 TaxID=3053985 RepID=UPI00259CD7D4|nr:hypothetical protein [Micromonospora sp. WMMA1363]MDM4722141.1 hypothetical protein [Micromonospora sp. WMMA1363]
MSWLNLLLSVALMMLAALAGGPLLARRARRGTSAAGGVPTVEDPLVTWVINLRRDAAVPARDAGRDGDVRSAGPSPAEPAGTLVGDQGELWPAGPRGLATACPTEESMELENRCLGGQRRSAGPPGRRDSRRPGGPDAPPSLRRRALRPPAAGPARRSAGPAPVPGRCWPAAGTVAAPEWRWLARLSASPRRTLLVAGLVAVALGAVTGGPVAAVAAGAYGTVGARALLRWTVSRHARLNRRHQLNQLCDLAADLRAGLPVTQAVALSTDGSGGVAPTLTRAAVHLADRTGAPLAELLERIDADARSADRRLEAAAAQAAGARVTAWLLAALPLAGIGLGYAIGVDPVSVLLRTPVGGGCAILAVVLQVAGLIWADRLTSIPRRGD